MFNFYWILVCYGFYLKPIEKINKVKSKRFCSQEEAGVGIRVRRMNCLTELSFSRWGEKMIKISLVMIDLLSVLYESLT